MFYDFIPYALVKLFLVALIPAIPIAMVRRFIISI